MNVCICGMRVYVMCMCVVCICDVCEMWTCVICMCSIGPMGEQTVLLTVEPSLWSNSWILRRGVATSSRSLIFYDAENRKTGKLGEPKTWSPKGMNHRIQLLGSVFVHLTTQSGNPPIFDFYFNNSIIILNPYFSKQIH